MSDQGLYSAWGIILLLIVWSHILSFYDGLGLLSPPNDRNAVDVS